MAERIKCAECGKFIPYDDMVSVPPAAKFFFEPESEFGREICEWVCAKCVKKDGV